MRLTQETGGQVTRQQLIELTFPISFCHGKGVRHRGAGNCPRQAENHCLIRNVTGFPTSPALSALEDPQA